MLHTLSLLVVLALPTVATAQIGYVPDERIAFSHDTGEVVATGTAREVVASFPVYVETARSLRLFFDEVELAGRIDDGTGAVLQITSLLDGHQQRLNAEHVEQWNHTSAYFNGSAVQVELIAAPGTGPSRVVLGALDVGPPLVTESQCGPVDDRELSNDPRVGRLMPVTCTAWMIDDCSKCFLSAGHCVGNISTMQFNVPLSTGSGNLVFPGPEDQYSVDQASIQSNGGQGTGNDWAYFGVFANSNTGLTPYEAAGEQAFELVDPPGTAGNTIRITGYGSDFSPANRNHVQQTHAGPFTSNGSVLQYQADTTGGNSGSPVIWDDTDQAIGIHTHAGCSTSGGGANQGTPITFGPLQDALENPQGICAAGSTGGPFTDLGGELGTLVFPTPPTLTACGTLEPDSPLSFTLRVQGFFMGTGTATLILGLSEISAPFQGGVLVPSPDFLLGPIPLDFSSGNLAVVPIETFWPASVPSGGSVYLQYWVNIQGIFTTDTLASNGLQMTSP